MPVLSLFYVFIVALLACQILVPVVSRLSIVVGGVDVPDERKVHKNAIPRLGGIAIFCSILLTTLILIPLTDVVRALLVGSCVVFLTGLVDDISGLTPIQKLLGQSLASVLFIFISNMKLTTVGNPFGVTEIHLGAWAIPFTAFVMVGLMNAINLLDGLDGLAGGVSVLAFVTFSILGYLTGNFNIIPLCIACSGATLGFLTFNTYPARIFMGDAGSLLLGFLLGVISIVLLSVGQVMVSPLTPVLVLSVPLIDTLIVMARRFLNSMSIMKPDRSHIHHQLMGIGLSHRVTVLVVYGLSYTSCLLALLLYNKQDYIISSVIFISVATVYPILLNYYRIQALFRKSYAEKMSNIITARKILSISAILLIIAKYLLVAVLISVFCCSSLEGYQSVFSWILIILIVALYFLNIKCRNEMLLVVLYLSAIFIVWRLVKHDGVAFGGVSCNAIHNVLFLCLFVVVGLKAAIRRRFAIMLNTPFEYLLIFIALTVTLLPESLKIEYQLGAIAARCIILFAAYKLVLIKDVTGNRKIILATLIALLPW